MVIETSARRRAAVSDPAAGTPRRLEPLRFVVFGRAVPAALFGYLSWLILQRTVASIVNLPAHPGALDIIGGPVRYGVYLMFCAVPVVLLLMRPMPTARDGRVLIRIAAVGGTTMLMAAGAIVPDGPLLVTMPPGTAAAGTLLLVAMEVLALFGLITLRRSFSIIPEARTVVTTGPYRFIRHPLYAAEIGAAIAIVMPSPRLWAVTLVPLFIFVQMIRASAEEKLLCENLPSYADYRQRTRRLIPGLW